MQAVANVMNNPEQDDGQVHERVKWGRVPEDLMHDKSMPDGAVRLYAHMIWRYGSNRRNFEARESMAGMLDVSEATITAWVAALVERDWVIAIPRSTFRNGRTVRTTNFYHIFPSQSKCREYRKHFNLPKPTLDEESTPFRKSRKGIGGRPYHKSKNELELINDNASKINSSSQIETSRKMNLSSPYQVNSSSRLLSVELDVDNDHLDSFLSAPSPNGSARSDHESDRTLPESVGNEPTLPNGQDDPVSSSVKEELEDPQRKVPAKESSQIDRDQRRCFVKGCPAEADYMAGGHTYCHMHARIVASLPPDYDPETYADPEPTRVTASMMVRVEDAPLPAKTPVIAYDKQADSWTDRTDPTNEKRIASPFAVPPQREWKVGERVSWNWQPRGGYGGHYVPAVVVGLTKKQVKILVHETAVNEFQEKTVQPSSLIIREREIQPLDETADKRIADAAAKKAKPATPKAYANTDIFNALGTVLFKAADQAEINAVGGRIGPLREQWVKHILEKRKPLFPDETDLDQPTIDCLLLLIEDFGKNWDETHPTKNGRPMDRPQHWDSFSPAWIAYCKTDRAKKICNAEPETKPCEACRGHGAIFTDGVALKCETCGGKGKVQS